MGCRLSGVWLRDGMEGNEQDLSHVSQWHELQTLGSYGQTIVQMEEQRGTSDCSTQTERLWETLRGQGIIKSPTPLLHTCTDRACCSHVLLSGDHYLPTISQDIDAPYSLPYQPESGDVMLEPPTAHQLLLHELDSGLGCTDGSFQQGDLSGMETEEDGMEDGTSHFGSSSSESFISSELSDSGFYSVRTGEFRRFQRLLEKKIKLYRARMGPHRESQCSRRELESIPETLTLQALEVYHSPGAHQRCPAGGTLPSIRSPESPCCNRNSPTAVPPVCCNPSCQQRVPPQHAPKGLMRRSSTLHCCTCQVSDRRRASHPISDCYVNSAMHRCPRVSAELPHGEDLAQRSQKHWKVSVMQQEKDQQSVLPGAGCSGEGPQPSSSEVVSRAPSNQWSEQWFHTIGHSQDIHDTWPKSVNRCRVRAGPYSTLDSHSPFPTKSTSSNPRALRNQLLRERASQLADERGGVTTDDETHGEATAGRYCSRTERRQQLQLAREQRLQALSRGAGAAGPNVLLELSHRKLSRLRNHKMLDDWTTVQELLTHGTRMGSREDVLCPGSLLSVTTV
ncbi:uncharacterized protein LOC108933594 isoform X2 [Scleropages formosus]|uniref:uncharacterized protein LOC108933594 isoform X2 n=1 Tax=Scleropages formosus TaxID=113540 RepID=UPI0010FA6ABD|nr:uncharacterized protein LOC108933594 isoform X2 [Scleropages formosus]